MAHEPRSASLVAAHQEITDVLVRYATGIDRRDWDLFRTCFTDDCSADYGVIGSWNGVDEITQWMDEAHRKYNYTLHRLTNPAISVTGDTATARSYVDALLMLIDGEHMNRGIGFYDDEFRLTDDGWKIARRQFTTVVLKREVPV